MRRTNIYLDEQQTASLDRLAHQEHVSRAELIRRLIDRALTGADASRGVDADLAVIEDSFGAMRDLQPPVRRPDGREQHLAEIWRQGR
jgi:hypothetical protein